MTGALACMDPRIEAAPYALLDDCGEAGGDSTSRLYTGHVRTHVCHDPADLDATWAAVEEDQAEGLHAVVMTDYEWGARLQQAGHERWTSEDLRGWAPALRVLMFRDLARPTGAEADAWLAAAEGAAQPGPAGVVNVRSRVDRPAFEVALAHIQERLRAGDTYQVNYTLRLEAEAFGSPLALYRRLRLGQPVRFGALIALGGDRFVLSLSPELFLRHEAGPVPCLMARPMKGTAARKPDAAEDALAAMDLASDRKNRAENVMIVDLLRNDLGRLARAGSVRVSELFRVEAYPTLFQLTSTILAEPRPDVRFPEVLRAAFPCGSITGAPKHRTMEIIAEVEESPRGLYCGALGWVDAAPPGQALGAFCLSVGIRTLLVEPPHPANSALRPLRLGVGAGIVLGSRAEGEYAEVMLKARFLTDLDPGFTLFETMLARAGAGVRHLELHLARLAGSARDLGFCCDLGALREGLAERAAGLPPGRDHRLRLDLAKDGRVALTHAPLEPLPGGGEGVALGLCTEPVQPHGLLSRHKTSHRPQYDSALCEIVARGRFDLLFLNGAGELVEGARSNVFLKLEGRWFTPPLSSGALPGIQRSLLLVDPAWGARERVLSGPDLVRAEAIVVCNALRGPLRARLAREARE